MKINKHRVQPLIHGVKAQQIMSLVACPSTNVYLDIVRRIIKPKKGPTKSLPRQRPTFLIIYRKICIQITFLTLG